MSDRFCFRWLIGGCGIGCSYRGGRQCCYGVIRGGKLLGGSATHFQNVGLNAMARAETVGGYQPVFWACVEVIGILL